MDNPIEEVVTDVVKKVSIKERVWKKIKRLLVILIVFKLMFQFVRWIANNARKSLQLQLDDDTWGNIIWIKFWRLLYGLIGGVLIQYHFDIYTKIQEWIIPFINEII